MKVLKHRKLMIRQSFAELERDFLLAVKEKGAKLDPDYKNDTTIQEGFATLYGYGDGVGSHGGIGIGIYHEEVVEDDA